MALTAIAFLVAMAIAVFTTLPDSGRWPGVARTATVLVWLVVAANVMRTIDDLVAVPASLAEQAVVVVAAIAGLGTVVALSLLGWRGTAGGMLATGMGGLLLMLFFGSESTAQLSASQIATVLPTWVRRWTVAASWMIIIPAFLTTGLGAVIHSRHLAATRPAEQPA